MECRERHNNGNGLPSRRFPMAATVVCSDGRVKARCRLNPAHSRWLMKSFPPEVGRLRAYGECYSAPSGGAPLLRDLL